VVNRARLAEHEQVARQLEGRRREREERKSEAARRAMETAQLESGLSGAAGVSERWESERRRETERRRELAVAMRQKRGMLERGWRRLLEEVSDERGPWAEPRRGEEEEEKSRWSVHRSESDSESWTRVLRKKNKHFDPHEGCARGAGTGAVAAAASTAAPAAFAAAFVRANEEEGEEDERGAEEEQERGGDEQRERNCRLVRNGKVKSGTLELSKTHVMFGAKAWPLEQLVEARGLRFGLWLAAFVVF
jgi:hypothetical protein